MGRSPSYRYPGNGINGVLGALQRANTIEFIQVRHQEMAAFMAVAHAKFTGEIGVCLSTGGPGATHLITGLYDGKLDHARCLRSDRRRRRFGALRISRSLTSTGCSPMSPTMYRKPRRLRRSVI